MGVTGSLETFFPCTVRHNALSGLRIHCSLRLHLHRMGHIRLCITFLVSFQSCSDTLVPISMCFLLGRSVRILGRLNACIPRILYFSLGLFVCLFSGIKTLIPVLLSLEI